MLNPNHVYEELVKAGEAWADSQHAAELYEETKKTLVAKLCNLAVDEKSIAAKEAYALRHPDYLKHIEDMVDYRKAANKAKVRYDSMKILAELKRTQAANERAANRYA